jgi:hypothetical protein
VVSWTGKLTIHYFIGRKVSEDAFFFVAKVFKMFFARVLSVCHCAHMPSEVFLTESTLLSRTLCRNTAYVYRDVHMH